MLRWAEHPAGTWALFVLAVAESSFFPIPPDALLAALSFGKPRRAFWFAAVCLAGSVLGGVIGYGIGWFLWQKAGVSEFFFSTVLSESWFERVDGYYQTHDILVVFVAAFTPIPYKVITISAGVFKLNFALFLLASIVGRGARFLLVGALVYWLGDRIRPFIEKHLNWVTIAFVVLLIGGFVLIKFLF